MEEISPQNRQPLSEADSLASIADFYYRGFGVAVDYERAFNLYHKAAGLGNAEALQKMGLCYENGFGVHKSYAEARSCYEKASDKGDLMATIRLGDMYWKGHTGVTDRNRLVASEYYLDALEIIQTGQDEWLAPDVYLRIADCLREGIGTSADYDKAAAYYSSAVEGFLQRIEQGDVSCEADLDRAEKNMTACQKKGMHQPTGH